MAIFVETRKLFVGVFLSVFIIGCGSGGGESSSANTNSDTDGTSNNISSNSSPEVNLIIPNQIATSGDLFELDISQSGNTFRDQDNDTLTYQVQTQPAQEGLSLSGTNLSGVITGSEDFEVIVTATDGQGAEGVTQFTVDVISKPIVANVIPNQSFKINEMVNLDITQAGMTFSDKDSSELLYSVTVSPSNMNLMLTGSMLSGTISQAGNYTITVTATDTDKLSVSTSFIMTISELEQAKKNILLIIADDLGQDASAQYSVSSDVPVTPNLNALAQSGLVFENLWVNPVCSPTRATLLTGKYGNRTNVLMPGDSLSQSEIILHERLKSESETQDYALAMIGKWHLGGGSTGPNDAGIEHFAGIINGTISDYYNWTLTINGEETNQTTYATTEITNQAISWLQAQSSPWFMWLAYNAPHTPFHLPPANLHSRTLSGTSEDIADNPRAYYLAAIEAMDSEIGRLISTIDANTLKNTVIVFIGDNGTPIRVRDRAAPLNGNKGTLYEGGIRVPMIVSGLGVTRQGEREAALINGTDFYVSLLELAGQNVGMLYDSQSFVELLSSSEGQKRTFIFSESDDGQTIRNGAFKLIENNTGVIELFNLGSDPGESNNLSGTNLTEQDTLSELLNKVKNES